MGITEAQVVIGVGGGVEKECMVMIERLAELLEGTIGGTRVAVFKELVSAERQIGATGKFIDADIYIPIGISGSNRHTVGIRNVKHVIPINKNKSAPIFKFAELGIVGDLNKVIEHLIKILEKS
ncbi:MAG: FAD-binding protein [Thermodesulfobacteriota bacterium]|nr:FAD-binding protein [Thermodesulfobacteriota bacterium]